MFPKIYCKKSERDELVWSRAAMKIQKTTKMILKRRKFTDMKKKANYIKGFFKMKWYSTAFQDIKKATLKIQVPIFHYFTVNKQFLKFFNFQSSECSCLISLTGKLLKKD